MKNWGKKRKYKLKIKMKNRTTHDEKYENKQKWENEIKKMRRETIKNRNKKQ